MQPNRVTCAYHLEMARTGVSPFSARKQWGGSLPHGIWTADRFGQSTTRLPDGRWVQIAGEHEASYDPDFVIFSDVVVHDGAGGMEVYFYPSQIFPPTDFHSASLVGDAIWIIGSTGYQGTRRAGETPVYRMDLADFSTSAVQTTGSLPGWIGRHRARACGDDIVIDGGWIWARERRRGLGTPDVPRKR